MKSKIKVLIPYQKTVLETDRKKLEEAINIGLSKHKDGAEYTNATIDIRPYDLLLSVDVDTDNFFRYDELKKTIREEAIKCGLDIIGSEITVGFEKYVNKLHTEKETDYGILER